MSAPVDLVTLTVTAAAVCGQCVVSVWSVETQQSFLADYYQQTFTSTKKKKGNQHDENKTGWVKMAEGWTPGEVKDKQAARDRKSTAAGHVFGARR